MTSGFGYAFLAVYIIYMTEVLGLGPAAVGLVFTIAGMLLAFLLVLLLPLRDARFRIER